ETLPHLTIGPGTDHLHPLQQLRRKRERDLGRRVCHEYERGARDPLPHTGEAAKQSAQVLVAVQVASIADESAGGRPRRLLLTLLGWSGGPEARELTRGHSAPSQHLTQLLRDRDAVVGATRHLCVEESAEHGGQSSAEPALE